MCEVCEGKEAIKAELQMKYCSIESYVAGMNGKVLSVSALVQEEHRLPFLVQFSFECNFCPKCGKKIKIVEPKKESRYVAQDFTGITAGECNCLHKDR